MIRTQVYLTENLHRDIKLMALRERKTDAQIIREALQDGLLKKRTKKTKGKGLLRLSELGKELDIRLEPDFSSKIDDYLYGDK